MSSQPHKTLTHFDVHGKAQMVDVSIKAETHRVAVATGSIFMKAETAAKIAQGNLEKGDVLGIARIAAVQGVKRTADLIPLCHPLRISGVSVAMDVVTQEPACVHVRAQVQAFDRTGVEMEALTAVSVATLTIYDMCKAIDRGMHIANIQLEEKRGGASGEWRRSHA